MALFTLQSALLTIVRRATVHLRNNRTRSAHRHQLVYVTTAKRWTPEQQPRRLRQRALSAVPAHRPGPAIVLSTFPNRWVSELGLEPAVILMVSSSGRRALLAQRLARLIVPLP